MTKRRQARFPTLLIAALVLAPLAPAGATVIVRTILSESSVAPGDSLVVSLWADISDPVLGWGVDLSLPGVTPVALPALGPDWTALPAGDGDGLAGQAFPNGVSGLDVLLVSLEVQATQAGTWMLGPSITPLDLTEGFALDPTGFEQDLMFVPAALLVIPEPATFPLVAGSLVVLVLARRRRGRERGTASEKPGPRG